MKKTKKIVYPPRKELGQNFLFEKNYLQKVVENCPIDTNTVIIEVGSGYGSLTAFLAETRCQKVISLEKDPKLFKWLLENNPRSEKVSFFHQDVLKVNWTEFKRENPNNSLIIVGNLPYYLTNSLIIDLLLNYNLFKSLVFLVQKEVARRWVASNNSYTSEYSVLSIFINFLAQTSLIFEVPSQVFVPPSAVEGALVVINPKKEIDLNKEQLIIWLNFLKNCFRFRRKTLLNNLLSFAGNWKNEWEKYFLEKNHSPKIRPQNLTPNQYWELFLFWKTLR